jgi:N-acetylglutamate synthase-like GNAT family acetyltransferase
LNTTNAAARIPETIMIKIQPFHEQHLDGVVTVILPIQQEEFDIAITLRAQPDLLDIPGFYQQGAGNFWIARQDDAVVGTIALLDIGNGQAALRKMFVKKDFLGQPPGVADRLWQTLLVWCTQHDIHTIYLGTTAKFKAAHRFYEKRGFTEIQETDLPASFPVMSVDTRFYRYLVNPNHGLTTG